MSCMIPDCGAKLKYLVQSNVGYSSGSVHICGDATTLKMKDTVKLEHLISCMVKDVASSDLDPIEIYKMALKEFSSATFDKNHKQKCLRFIRRARSKMNRESKTPQRIRGRELISKM